MHGCKVGEWALVLAWNRFAFSFSPLSLTEISLITLLNYSFLPTMQPTVTTSITAKKTSCRTPRIDAMMVKQMCTSSARMIVKRSNCCKESREKTIKWTGKSSQKSWEVPHKQMRDGGWNGSSCDSEWMGMLLYCKQLQTLDLALWCVFVWPNVSTFVQWKTVW